jgi:hypothetical protein
MGALSAGGEHFVRRWASHGGVMAVTALGEA